MANIVLTLENDPFFALELSQKEFSGVQKYWDKHPSLPLETLALIYVRHLRKGVDLNNVKLTWNIKNN